VTKTSAINDWTIQNEKSFVRVTHLRIEHTSCDTILHPPHNLTHFELIFTDKEKIISSEFIELLKLVEYEYGFIERFSLSSSSSSSTKCLCVMQSVECKRNYVALFCAIDACVRNLIKTRKSNLRDTIRNVRLQLNEPERTLASFEEYRAVYRIVLKYARYKRFTRS
jgi:hypothetical protein